MPPLLANAYTGLRQIDPETREAAKGMGLSGGQLLRQVELPLSVPYLAAGLRTAAVQVVATAALAAFVNGGGLGEIISAGFGIGMSAGGGGQIVAGGIAVAAARTARRGRSWRAYNAWSRPGRCGPGDASGPLRRYRLGNALGIVLESCHTQRVGLAGNSNGHRSPTARRTRGAAEHGRAGTQKAAVCVDTCS